MSAEPSRAHAAERPLAGMAANAAAFLVFTIGDGMTKAITATMPIMQAAAIRTCFLLLILSPLFIATGRRREPVIATRRPWLHLTRFACIFLSVVTGFTAMRELPLPTVSAISFVAPIFVTFMAAPILGERVRAAHLVALAFGMAGCIAIVGPMQGGDVRFMLLSLLSAAFWSASLVLLRLLTRTENAAAIFIWGNGWLAVVAMAIALFDWRPLETRQILFLIGMAACQAVGQYLALIAFRIAAAATLAPVQYTQLLWASLIGAVVFNDWPQPSILAGAALIIAGGVWLMQSERKRA